MKTIQNNHDINITAKTENVACNENKYFEHSIRHFIIGGKKFKECRTRMWHEVAKRLVVKFGGNHLYLVTRPDYCGDRDWNTGDGEITEIWR